MSRPIKAGIDYFPLDVIMDEKVELIDAKYGNAGFGVLIKLYQSIYRNGYFLEVDEEKLLLLKNRLHVEIDFLNSFITDCLRWKIFDAYLYEKYQILTSKGIQNRYVEATKRRKEISFTQDFLLISGVSENYGNRVNVNINSINADINLNKENIKKQSKVKESKDKENKRKLLEYLSSQIKEKQLTTFTNKLIEFCEYRKKLNKPYKTEYGINGLIADAQSCIELGLDVNQCIDKAMTSGWLKFYYDEFKEKRNGKKNEYTEPVIRTMKTGAEIDAEIDRAMGIIR